MVRIKRVAGVLAVVVAFAGFATVMAQRTPAGKAPVAPQSTVAKQTFDHAGYVKEIKPFFSKYCIECHTAAGTEKDLPPPLKPPLASTAIGDKTSTMLVNIANMFLIRISCLLLMVAFFILRDFVKDPPLVGLGRFYIFYDFCQ